MICCVLVWLTNFSLYSFDNKCLFIVIVIVFAIVKSMDFVKLWYMCSEQDMYSIIAVKLMMWILLNFAATRALFFIKRYPKTYLKSIMYFYAIIPKGYFMRSMLPSTEKQHISQYPSNFEMHIHRCLSYMEVVLRILCL